MALESPNRDDITPSTVVLRGQDELEYDTAPAAEAITPGMLLEQRGNSVGPHSTSGDQAAAPLIAIESRLFGMTADSPRADAFDTYNAGDNVWHAHFDTGHWAYGLLAPGETVDPTSATVENRVVSDGAGGFRVFDPVDTAANDDPSAILGEAIRTPVDNAAGTDYARFKVRFY